jgi:hypothetical protein
VEIGRISLLVSSILRGYYLLFIGFLHPILGYLNT